MSSSNQRPANRGFRSVLRCAITHYRQSPWLSAPEPSLQPWPPPPRALPRNIGLSVRQAPPAKEASADFCLKTIDSTSADALNS